MDKEKALEALGLSQGETKVYLSLLKLGSAPVHKIKEDTGLHRTTIYDFLEKLINRGLVSYILSSGAKYYRAASPEQLFSLVSEKEENLKEILPELSKMALFHKEDLSVEVYRGKEAFRALMTNVIKEKTEVMGIGIEESYFRDKFPYLMERYFKEELRLGIKEKIIVMEGSKFVFPYKNVEYRTLAKEFFGPTPLLVFGIYSAIFIWEPLTLILIKNPELAGSFRKYISMIWKLARPIKTFK